MKTKTKRIKIYEEKLYIHTNTKKIGNKEEQPQTKSKKRERKTRRGNDRLKQAGPTSDTFLVQLMVNRTKEATMVGIPAHRKGTK